MHLDDHALLDLWARANQASSVMRPAVLLDALAPKQGRAAVDIPIGERDLTLISTRARHFGSAMTCATSCASCAEKIEISFDLSDLEAGDETESVLDLTLTHEGEQLALRKPTTRDLTAAAAAGSGNALSTLVRRCLTDPDNAELPATLPNTLIEQASTVLQAADPDADIELGITCPSCQSSANAPFDIGLCLWEDISRTARRLMREVHYFASTYGWSEAETLAVPRQRRLQYLKIGST